MAVQKFLALVLNRIKEVAPIQTSVGAGDEGKIPALDASGRLDPTMMPVGLGADTHSVITSENLSAGNIVNVYNNAGTPTARKADASTQGKEADGFVLASTTSGQNALVYYEGRVTGLAGLTIGAYYYLDPATPGGLIAESALAPASANVVQRIGKAVTSSTINFEPDAPITVA